MREGWKRLLDLLFPRRCVFCGAVVEGDLPCAGCQSALPWLEGMTAERGYQFVSCCASALRYTGGARRAVVQMKFHRRVGYGRTLGPITAQCARDHLAGRFDLVTWVPLSPKSLRRRGFDQSRVLAEYVAGAFGLEPVGLLKKDNGAKRQSSIRGDAQRRANVLGVFSAGKGAELAGRRVLVVDDVVTSGATLSECARVLRMAGAEDVVAVTLARAGK